MSKLDLTVVSFTAPTLPETPADISTAEVRSPLPARLQAISPLEFEICLPGARKTNRLFPATHLQILFKYDEGGDAFVPNQIVSSDLIETATENVFRAVLSPDCIPRHKVNPGASGHAEVRIYVWKNERLLDKFVVGRIEDLGFRDLKNFPLHARRMEAWSEAAEKNNFTQL